MSHKFKISIDIHGVIDELPQFFSHMSHSLVNSGMEVHIVTGGSYTRAERELKMYDISYTHLFSILDHHKNIGTPTFGNHPMYGFPMIDDDIWDKTKGVYCDEHGIHLHLDDTIAYGDSFTTPFAKVWTKTKGEKYKHKL
jgi:hypothetical protein